MQILFVLGCLPLFSLAFLVLDRAGDLRQDAAERARVFSATWGTLFPLDAGGDGRSTGPGASLSPVGARHAARDVRPWSHG